MERFWTCLGYLLCTGLGAAIGGAIGFFIGASRLEPGGDAMLLMGAWMQAIFGAVVGGAVGLRIAFSGKSRFESSDDD